MEDDYVLSKYCKRENRQIPRKLSIHLIWRFCGYRPVNGDVCKYEAVIASNFNMLPNVSDDYTSSLSELHDTKTQPS